MYWLILFLCGISLMILELAGMRIISPYCGATRLVNSTTITVIMVSLSFGYIFGGKLSSKNPDIIKLSLFFVFNAIYLFLFGFIQFELLGYILKHAMHIILQNILCSLIIFPIPNFLLGISFMYLFQLTVNNNFVSNENIGVYLGKYYSVFLIGTVFGIFLFWYYLIIKFGIDKIFLCLSLILAICSLICSLLCIKIPDKKYIGNLILYFSLFLIFTILICLLYFTSYIKLSYSKNEILNYKPKIIYYCTTPYNYYSIYDYNIGSKKIRILHDSVKSAQSIINKSNYNDFLFDYMRLFNAFFLNKKKNNNILILGNCVGSFLTGTLQNVNKLNMKDINFDVIEIDKKCTEIGAKYFSLPIKDNRINFYYQDARIFINNFYKDKKYDLIFFDTYSGSPYLPYYLITKESFKKLFQMTDDDGILLINVLGNRQPNGKNKMYIDQICTQVKSVFPEVLLYSPVETDNVFSNYVIAAYKSPDNFDSINIKKLFNSYKKNDVEYSFVVFTDKFSPIEKFE